MKATKEGKLIKTTGDILGNPKVQKTIKSMVKSLLPITERTQYCIVDCGKEICQCKPTNKIQMSKEKTAMQMLIEKIESLADKFQPNTHAKRIYLGLRDKIVNMNLLKKEQEQIEQAFSNGFDDGENYDREIDERESSSNYYQSKYVG